MIARRGDDQPVGLPDSLDQLALFRDSLALVGGIKGQAHQELAAEHQGARPFPRRGVQGQADDTLSAGRWP